MGKEETLGAKVTCFSLQMRGQSCFIALISGPHVEYVPVHGGLITQQCGAHLKSISKSSLIPDRSYRGLHLWSIRHLAHQGRTHHQIDGVWTCDLHRFTSLGFFHWVSSCDQFDCGSWSNWTIEITQQWEWTLLTHVLSSCPVYIPRFRGEIFSYEYGPIGLGPPLICTVLW